MLYHYTSLATFALILTTKSIKFNRLDLVDDPDESLFGYGDSDMKLNSSSFVSCWTEDKVENIALWKMYTDLKGVRIGHEIARIGDVVVLKTGKLHIERR